MRDARPRSRKHLIVLKRSIIYGVTREKSRIIRHTDKVPRDGGSTRCYRFGGTRLTDRSGRPRVYLCSDMSENAFGFSHIESTIHLNDAGSLGTDPSGEMLTNRALRESNRRSLVLAIELS
ncbi:hypothetical protein EVAR_17468_1 [Eumeta japonica]|uniref:Uncharacterized protein n=1 Tax=Eumeta variegata TaxID=151549 RepID=A0A4C1VDA9_EUMVA|nr:hypothetical protein EVAR_17468_1 [Eumeta japonica]